MSEQPQSKELSQYLDQLVIASENIGDIRRRLMMPWDCMWNGIVRDETAKRENKAPKNGSSDTPSSPSLAGPPREEQLRAYVQHKPECAKWWQAFSVSKPILLDERDCTCGLLSLLAAVPSSAEGKEDLVEALRVPVEFWRSYFKSHSGPHWSVTDEFWREWLDAYGHLIPESK